MNNALVTDTGPLIALAHIELLSILPRLFNLVYVPDAVAIEATHDLTRPGAHAIDMALTNDWFIRMDVKLGEDDHILCQLLDHGEAACLALAAQLNAAVLLDERRARQVAIARGIPITGTAAILIKAKQKKLIRSVKPLLAKLTNMGYRLSPALIEHVLTLAGE